MIWWLFWFIFLLAIVLAGFWYESTPWRFCRRCGYFWSIRTGKQYNYLPPEADGVAKNRDCPGCSGGRRAETHQQKKARTKMSKYSNHEIELTTNHAASSYGQPVLVIDGEAYGPFDETPVELGGKTSALGIVRHLVEDGELSTDEAIKFGDYHHVTR